MHIGLDNVYIADITEDASGYETYGTPVKVAPAISAGITINKMDTPFYADDELNEQFDDFIDGKLSLNVKELPATIQQKMFGIHQDANGVLIYSAEDAPKAVAVLFRSLVRAGVYGYYTLYRVQFAPPGSNFNTKSNSITINTPTVEGTIMRRHKPNALGDHPWKASLLDDGTPATAAIIADWFNSVYEYVAPVAQSGQT